MRMSEIDHIAIHEASHGVVTTKAYIGASFGCRSRFFRES